jgi:hypothetical protein
MLDTIILPLSRTFRGKFPIIVKISGNLQYFPTFSFLGNLKMHFHPNSIQYVYTAYTIYNISQRIVDIYTSRTVLQSDYILRCCIAT